MSTSSANADRLFGLVVTIDAWSEACESVASHGAPWASGAGAAIFAVLAAVRGLVADQRGVAKFLRAVGDAFVTADRRRGATLLAQRFDRVSLFAGRWAMRHRTDQRAATLMRRAIIDVAHGKLLQFDPNGDGRVVEVLGDLATADHLAVLIPGMTNTADNYLSGERKKAANLLLEMQKRAKAGETVAVVSWLGYDTPDFSLDGIWNGARRSDVAKVGAKDLGEDLKFIQTVNPRAQVTVIGHSYGSIVLGQAMRQGLLATDAIAVGSPGMDANDRKDLGSPNVKLWAAHDRFRNIAVNETLPTVHIPFTKVTIHPGVVKIPIGPVPVDFVSDLPGHGEDPAADGFHANRFRAGKIKSHGGYFNKGTESLTNMALIATAQPPATT